MSKKVCFLITGFLFLQACSTLDAGYQLAQEKYLSSVVYDTSNCQIYEDDQKIKFCEKQKVKDYETFKTWSEVDCYNIESSNEKNIGRGNCLRVIEEVANKKKSQSNNFYLEKLKSFQARASAIPKNLDEKSYIDAKSLVQEIESVRNEIPNNTSELLKVSAACELLAIDLSARMSSYSQGKDKNQRVQANIKADPETYAKCKTLKPKAEIAFARLIKIREEHRLTVSETRKKELMQEAENISYEVDQMKPALDRLQCERFFVN